ncbi:MAG: SapC family protein [Thermodesulfobacteriota bacterium]|nr:SapC family protein [Thermodesulfobacteriota bacterium]
MPKFIPVTKTDFADKRWNRISKYSFTSDDTICPLVVQEMTKAVLSLPIAIAYINEQPTPVAVQGIKPNSNVLVDGNGKWLGRYIPAAYRSYPFVLAKTDQDDQVLCFDEDSELFSTDGEAFFDDNGDPSETVKGIMSFLTQVQKSRISTQQMCTLLHDKELIQPWPITIKAETAEVPVEGLFRINEAALNALDKDDFDEVRQAGALPLIYCQLLSMQHLMGIMKLVEQRDQQVQNQATQELDIDKMFGESDGLFKF